MAFWNKKSPEPENESEGMAEARRRIEQARRMKGSFLSLSNLNLSTLPESLWQLTDLVGLDLSDNWLTTLPESLVRLTKLQELFLYNNQLTMLPEALSQLTNLQELHLNNTRLTVLPEALGQLTKLRMLDLSSSQLTALPEALGQLTKLKRLFLHDNDALGLPPEVLGPRWDESLGGKSSASPRDILDYYFKTRQQARPLDEVKLLLVGRGKSGKSSIRDRLLHGTFDENKKETPGIDIQNWELECGESKVHVHVWDFAGQEITHATHQFFLTERSVYLLVLDARSDTQDRDAEYWLRLIDGFGKGSPIFVALNQWDEKPFAVDEHELRGRYPGIRKFFCTDCKTKRGLEELKKELQDLLRDWKEVHESFPAQWWGVKERFTKPKENYLPFKDYRSICVEKGVTDTEEQARLARILHALGVILHYADDARLRDTTVLNPQWVTTGVYTLLRLKERPGTNGTLTVDEAAAALPGEPHEMVKYLMGLMRRFELCYPLDEQETQWLVPQLLERFQPALGPEWSAADATRLRYGYKVVPEGLVPRFIVRTHPLGERELRWRNGVVLRLDGASALVKAETADNRVSVVAIGDSEARLRLVKLVRCNFTAMHADLRGLNPTEALEVEGHPGIFKDVQVLERDERKPDAITTVDTPGGSVKIDQTRELNRVSAPAARDPQQPRVNIFVSYSHTDRSLLDVFATNLEVMKADGLVRVWTDAQIPPSADWDKDIRRELEEADIVVLMVSVAFLSRPYIRGVELGRAIERKAAGESEIFILVLEPQCPWKTKRKVKQRRKDASGAEREEEIEVELGKYQALLPKNPKVQRWPNQPAAFNHVDAALRETITEVLARSRRSGRPADDLRTRTRDFAR
jgi:internalin A